MAMIFRFLTSLRTAPRRAILLELGFVILGGLLLGVALFQLH
jgi:LPS O-antigen subunit length determinant protein (WzzB/FepE family)